MPAGEGSQRPKQFVKHPGLVLRPDKKIWRLRCGVRGGQGEPLDEEGPDSGKEPQSTDRAAPLCLLSAGLRVCSQHSARLEKEEPVQKPCRSVKGGRSTGQARGWGPGVEGTAWAEFEGPTAHPPTICNIHTFCHAEGWYKVAGPAKEMVGSQCRRNGGVKGGQKAH